MHLREEEKSKNELLYVRILSVRIRQRKRRKKRKGKKNVKGEREKIGQKFTGNRRTNVTECICIEE